MGEEIVSDLPDGYDANSLRKTNTYRKPNLDLIGWSFTCYACDSIDILRTDEEIIEDQKKHGSRSTEMRYHLKVPNRCEQCTRDKYVWQTRQRLSKTIPERVKGKKPLSLCTYTLGIAEFVHGEHEADTRYYELHKEMKLAFRNFIRSKWWRNRVDGAFYTIEVKRTNMPDGTIKLHPHVHALVSHKFADFQQAAEDRGLGTYVKIIRLGKRRIDIICSVRYILKYAFKEYGDPLFKGRYYETTGCFRKSSQQSNNEDAKRPE